MPSKNGAPTKTLYVELSIKCFVQDIQAGEDEEGEEGGRILLIMRFHFHVAGDHVVKMVPRPPQAILRGGLG